MKKLRTNGNTAFLPSNNILLWGRFFLRISTLSMQIKIGLKNVLKENVEKLLVAYEPDVYKRQALSAVSGSGTF